MLFVRRSVMNHRRTGLVAALIAGLTAVSLVAGGAAFAEPYPQPDPKGQRPPRLPALPWPQSTSETKKEPPRLPTAPLKANSLNEYRIVTGDMINLNPGDFLSARVACPAGLSVLGGGEYNTNSGNVVLSDTYPDSAGSWRVWVRNNSPGTSSFRAYAICGSGIDRHQLVAGGWTESTPWTNNGAFAACPDGTLRLSGGETNTSWGQILLNGSHPGSDRGHPIPRYGWSAAVVNDSSTAGSFQSIAVCGTGLDRYEIVSGNGVLVPKGGYVSASATCPAGTVALGGGGRTSGGTDLVFTDSYPSSAGAWTIFARSRNTGSFDDYATAVVVCGG